MVRLPYEEAVRGTPPVLGEVADGVSVLGGPGDATPPYGGG